MWENTPNCHLPWSFSHSVSWRHGSSDHSSDGAGTKQILEEPVDQCKDTAFSNSNSDLSKLQMKCPRAWTVEGSVVKKVWLERQRNLALNLSFTIFVALGKLLTFFCASVRLIIKLCNYQHNSSACDNYINCLIVHSRYAILALCSWLEIACGSLYYHLV